MKVKLMVIPDEDDDEKVTLVDAKDNKLGEMTWVQRFTNREDIPLPDQVLLTFGSTTEAMQVFHFLWTEAMKRELWWRVKKAA